ncbi:rhomboid-related protein 2-like [Ostrea edulis]|uniref:rhomboid-related protein 2-like n=1 Tax=Ostrea edulis TaxID=37623 RepID=UPI0024AF9D0B|nr:rhomboid-related protein 2-like [Ostrea edulis]
MAVQGRRDRRVGSREEVAMEERRDDLIRRFRPMFDKHGRQGVPLRDLREELEEEGLTESIAPERLDELLRRADRDGDKRIRLGEFVRMMTGDNIREHEKRKLKGLLGAAIANIVPQSQREDFMANYNCKPPPIFMIIISIIEIIIFIVYAEEQKSRGTATTATSGVPLYSPLLYKPTRRYEAWRFVTYMFLHQGYIHLISNLIFQLLLGLPLELVHKFWRVLLIYVLGVIAGSLAHSVTDHAVSLCGASGGCYALIGAHIASIITNWKEMNYKCCDGSILRFLLSAPVRLTIFLVLSIGDTSVAVYRRFFEEGAAKIGISAHIGGMMAGLLVGIPLLKNVNILPWERKLGWVSLIIYLLFVAFAMFFNGLYKGYPETDWSSCCPV